MSDYIDEQLRQHFSSAPSGNLPSNFSWLVMQKVFVERVEQARRKAWTEILVVWLMILVSAGLLGSGLWLYADQPVWQFEVPRLGLACAGTFALFGLVDLVVRSRMAR